MKMDTKSIEWDRFNMEEGQDWLKFISAGGTNGYGGETVLLSSS